MHRFYSSDRTPSGPEGLETEHRTREPFDCAMILLDEIVKELGVANNDGRLMYLIVACDRRRVAPTLINRDLFGQSLVANGLL